MNGSTSPSRLLAPALALALLAGGGTPVVPGAAPPDAGAPIKAGEVFAAGADRMSGLLRHAIRVAGRVAGPAISSDGSAPALSGLQELSHRLTVRPSEKGVLAMFRAILDGGTGEEIQELEARGARIRGHMGPVVTFEAPLGMAGQFASLPAVRYLDLGRRMRPELDISGPETGADMVRDPVSGFGGAGGGVLVAVIDTGQDVKHKDFRHADKTTRFKAVWNMNPSCDGKPPPGHSVGCYYTERRINKHLRRRAGLKYKDPGITGGHGTHVMGIAAGNGLDARKGFPSGVYVGMAPEADLLGVKVYDGRGSFVGDVTEALQFLMEEQARQGDPPLVVNISFGQQFGAHDGSDPAEVAIDAFVQGGLDSGITRVVVKSAGNDGGTGMYLTDSLASPTDHLVTVPTLDPNGVSCGSFIGTGNDQFVASLWYPGDTTINVEISSPGDTFSFGNSTGHDPNAALLDTPAGSIFVDCPAGIHPVNGDRECLVGVADLGGVPPAEGTWTVHVERLSGPTNGEFDAWMPIGEVGICAVGWDSPSTGGTISIPGTAQHVITTGAYVTRTDWINFKGDGIGYVAPLTVGDIAPFSSQGPTRDGRLKPELVAPGIGIASARSRTVSIKSGTEGRLRTVEDKKHQVLEGTSMAAPHVAGAAAQLLSLDPYLTATEIRALLVNNTATDGFTGGGLPDMTWGHGKLDVFSAAVDHLGPP